MSRADWSFLGRLLEEGQEFSTGVGRVWLTVLFLFRMLVLGGAVESAWDDEQDDFVCNTKQPGCTPVCYDRAFPISHFRYFVLQVIFVSTPTVFYFGYVALRFGRKAEEEGEKKQKGGEDGCNRSKRLDVVVEGAKNGSTKDSTEEKKKEDDGGKGRQAFKSLSEGPKLKGRLLCAYAFTILLKVLLESGFIVGLWFLYGGFIIAPKFECSASPCPHTVDCFVSRPTEKTVFTIYTQAIAAVSLLLNLIELLHIFQLAITRRLEKRFRMERQDYLACMERVTVREEAPEEPQPEVAQACEVGDRAVLPTQGDMTRYHNPCELREDLVIEVNRGPWEDGDNMLPSYTNCMEAMRTTHSATVHYKKHTPNARTNVKAAHPRPKRHAKLKHYV